MAGESSSTLDNKTASQNADSYIGTFLSVTSKAGIRYEGTVCYLNLTDCTLGLKDVRSFGTEGRRANGTEIPPSEKVYQCIMFRGTDIKEMESKAAPPIQVEESIHSDPAIIQASYSGESSFSSRPLSAGAAYSELSILNAMSHPSISSPNYSVTQSGTIDSSHVAHSAFSPSSSLRRWQGYNHVPSHIAGAHEHSLSSSSELYPPQNQLHTSTELSNSTHNVSPAHSFSAPSSINFKTTHDLTPEHHPLPFTGPFPSSLASNHSNAGNSNGLTTPLPSSHQTTSSVGSPAVSEVAPGPRFSFPAQSAHFFSAPSSINLETTQDLTPEHHPPPFTSPFSSSLASNHSNAGNSYGLTTPLPSCHQRTSSVGSPAVGEVTPGPRFSLPAESAYTTPSISGPLSEPTLLTSNSYSRPKLSELSNADTNFSTPAPSAAVQPPLLPLPPPSQKLQYQKKNNYRLNGEFNFEAMNEKFKKDEIWEDLGKRSKRYNKMDETHNLKSDTQPAYEKDGFFDTISCHSIGRGARNQSSERIKCNSETFGSRGRGNHRSQQYRGRGRGVHQPR